MFCPFLHKTPRRRRKAPRRRRREPRHRPKAPRRGGRAHHGSPPVTSGGRKWNRGATVAAAPRAPGPTSPTARHRVVYDLRTDERWTGCPSLAVVYWPPHAVSKPCPTTGAPHPCRPPPAGPGRCDVRLIVARPRAKRRANRSPMKLDPTTVRARPRAVSMTVWMSISVVRRVASACLCHRLIASDSPR